MRVSCRFSRNRYVAALKVAKYYFPIAQHNRRAGRNHWPGNCSITNVAVTGLRCGGFQWTEREKWNF